MCDCSEHIAEKVALAILIVLLCTFILYAITVKQPSKAGTKGFFKKVDKRLKGMKPFSYFTMDNIPEFENYEDLPSAQQESICAEEFKRKISTSVPEPGTINIFYIGESDGSLEHVTRAIVMFNRLSSLEDEGFDYPSLVTITEEMKDDLLTKHNIIVSSVEHTDGYTSICLKR